MKVVSLPQRRRAREARLIDLLARANHVLAEGFHAQVRARCLSVTEWRVLAALAERDGVPMMDLGQKVLFKQPTLTKVIDRMERASLVQRRTAPEDRRRTLVDLTEDGRRLATPLLASARDHEAWVARALGSTGIQKCRAMLVEIVDRLGSPRWSDDESR
jgi:DNA-binding MarR family transcriptional regulator